MNVISIHPKGSWWARLRNWQPRAQEIRFEECRCQPCQAFGLLSYRLPGDALRDERIMGSRQACHYWCPHCGISQPGYRPKYQVIHSHEKGGKRYA